MVTLKIEQMYTVKNAVKLPATPGTKKIDLFEYLRD